MVLAVDVPNELYDDAAVVPAVCTVEGEMLARVDDVPAGAWLAVAVEGVDVAKLSAWDLPSLSPSGQPAAGVGGVAGG